MSDTLIIILFITAYCTPIIYYASFVIREKKYNRKITFKTFLKSLRIPLLLFALATIVVLTLNKVNYLNYESPIPFSQIDSISFENFRGLEFFKRELYGNEEYAYIVTSIDLNHKEDYVIIEALFHPSRSYVYNSHIHDEYLLAHELTHFKITELFARKARKKVKEENIRNKKEMSIILSENWTQERAYQKRYDYDTFHSYVMKEQKKYEKDVDSLLLLYCDYENPKILFNAKK